MLGQVLLWITEKHSAPISGWVPLSGNVLKSPQVSNFTVLLLLYIYIYFLLYHYIYIYLYVRIHEFSLFKLNSFSYMGLLSKKAVETECFFFARMTLL